MDAIAGLDLRTESGQAGVGSHKIEPAAAGASGTGQVGGRLGHTEHLTCIELTRDDRERVAARREA